MQSDVTEGVEGGLDRTVVVDRGEADLDRTVLVDRGEVDNDSTVVVDRGDSDADRTVVVNRKPKDPEATVVVGKRGSRGTGGKPKAAPARAPRGRQRINLPPVEPGFAEKAVIASGPGAVETYAARELPVPPQSAPRTEQAAVEARPPAAAVPSVRKSSRRFGVAALAGFVLACVISVTGLVAIAFTVFGSL